MTNPMDKTDTLQDELDKIIAFVNSKGYTGGDNQLRSMIAKVASPTPQVSVDDLNQLETAIIKEIENPTVKSEFSTSDIRVMGISSTGMEDRMFTIMKLIRVALAQATEQSYAEGKRDGRSTASWRKETDRLVKEATELGKVEGVDL